MDKIYLLAFGVVCVVTYLCFGSRLYVRLAVAGGLFYVGHVFSPICSLTLRT